MLFWMFVIFAIVGIGCFVLGKWMYDNTRYDTGWLEVLGFVIAILAVVVVSTCLIVIFANLAESEALVAKHHERYKSLTYQLENHLYDNDNDVGKKELYKEIREWNEDLAYYRAIQDDFWVGIFVPNVFDRFEFIEYPEGNK